MIPIARGQAIKMSTWPPSPVVHACWLDDAVQRIDCGHGNVTEEPMVVAACGAWAASEDVHETDAPVDCMTCLVRRVKYDRSLDEDSPD
jgi:hypothetical protein